MFENTPLPPPPKGSLLKWIAQKPEEFSAYLHRVYALSRLEVVVNSGGQITRSPIVFSKGNAAVSIAVAAGQTFTFDPTEVNVWTARIAALGGTLAADSLGIATGLAREIQSRSYNQQIVYLLPLLGGDLTAARVPLRDTFGVGAASTIGFVGGDFSQAAGLQADGATKYFEFPLVPSDIGLHSNGGMGYWENKIDLSSSHEPMGSWSSGATSAFVLDLQSTIRVFSWGATANFAASATAATNGHYYGQRSSPALREFFIDGVSLATNTAVDSAAGANNTLMRLMAVNIPGTGTIYWPGRCAVAYFTQGQLSADDVADFHALLRDFLITPTGRPT